MRLTEQNVKEVLIDASMTKTVFLYFYQDVAECDAQTKALTTAISDDNAYINLVMANLEDPISQTLAMQLRLEGVPCLVIFKNGQPVDALLGKEILDELTQIINDNMPSEDDLLVKEALELEQNGDIKNATAKALEAYKVNDSVDNRLLLARLYIKAKNIQRAEELLEMAGREERERKDYQDLISALNIAKQALNSPEIIELEKEYLQDKSNKEILQKYAIALSNASRNKEALDILFDNYKVTFDDDIKKVILDILNTLTGDPLQNQYRRKLYTLMY